MPARARIDGTAGVGCAAPDAPRLLEIARSPIVEPMNRLRLFIVPLGLAGALAAGEHAVPARRPPPGEEGDGARAAVQGFLAGILALAPQKSVPWLAGPARRAEK